MEIKTHKIMWNNKAYIVRTSNPDIAGYMIPTDKDILQYKIDLDDWEGTIHAKIINPSQHTLHLIEEGRCYITINCRNFVGHGPMGNHHGGLWDSDDPRKIDPNWYHMVHSSGLGRGSYRFHKHWSLCINSDESLLKGDIVQVEDCNNIEIPLRFNLSRVETSWGTYYYTRNINGHMRIERNSDNYENPYRDNFYFDIRLALLSSPIHSYSTNMRAYQTKSKITRITFDR